MEIVPSRKDSVNNMAFMLACDDLGYLGGTQSWCFRESFRRSFFSLGVFFCSLWSVGRKNILVFLVFLVSILVGSAFFFSLVNLSISLTNSFFLSCFNMSSCLRILLLSTFECFNWLAFGVRQ